MEESGNVKSGEEDVIAHGFIEFSEEENAGFMLKCIDLKTPVKNEYVAFAIGKACFVAGTKRNSLVRKKLGESEDMDVIQIPTKTECCITKLFMDPSGLHCIILTTKLDHFYLNYGSNKVFPLPKLKGIDVTSIAFSSELSAITTNEMLIGTKKGKLFNYVLELEETELFESEAVEVFELPNKSTIYGLAYEKYKCVGKDDSDLGVVGLVMAVTLDACYQFTGRWPFSQLFSKYKTQEDLDKHKKAVPSNGLKQSELKLLYTFNENNTFELRSFAWKCSIGVLYGNFRGKDDLKGHIAVKDFIAQGYQKQGAETSGEIAIPEAIGISEHSIYFLYADNLTVISRITKEIEHSETFREEAKEISFDSNTKSMWITTSKSVNRLLITGNAKDIWKKQLDSSNFVEAIKLCKQNNLKYYGFVVGAYADSKFKNHKYIEAADLYAQSTKPFEEIVLKYLVAGENDGLESNL